MQRGLNMLLQELTSTNIKSLSIDELTILHRGVHRGAKGGGGYDLLTSSHKLLAMELERKGVGHGTPLAITKPTPTINAIYLKSPHGTLIADGKKRAIAKSRPVNGMQGERIIVSKENGVGLAFGVATIGAPEPVTSELFDKRFDEHRVTSKERLRWWEGVEKLALYPILSFTPFDPPREVSVPPGTQTLMTNVKFSPDLMHSPSVTTMVTNQDKVKKAKQTKQETKMPWKVFKRGNEWCVFKIMENDKPTGKTLGCHNTPGAARSQVRALFASESKKMIEEVEAVIDDVLDTPMIMPASISVADGVDMNKVGNEIAQTMIRSMKAGISKQSVTKAAEPNQTTCTCPNCKEVSEHEPGTTCNELECPKCKAMLRGGGDSEKSQSEISAEVLQVIADMVHARIQAEKEVESVLLESTVEETVVEVEPIESKAGRRVRKDRLAKLKDLFAQFKELLSWAAYDDVVPDTVLPTAKAFKAADGKVWFMLWTTNSYKDRDEEIFRIKAIEDYVTRYQANPIKGEFQFWHIPGTKFGDIVWQAIIADRFLVQMGPFDDTPIGNAFKSFFTSHPNNHPVIAPTGWGASHGYNYIGSDRADGVYDWFNTVESSVLPTVYAANLHNPNPIVLGGKEMDDKQTAALRAISDEVDVDLVAYVTEVGKQKRAELDDFVEHKSVEQETEQPTASETPVTEDAKSVTELQASEGTQDVRTVESITAAVVEALRMESLSDTIKSMADNSAKVATTLTELTTRVAELEQTDEKKIAKQMPVLPQFSWFQASKAQETILTPKESELIPATSRNVPVLPIPGQQSR